MVEAKEGSSDTSDTSGQVSDTSGLEFTGTSDTQSSNANAIGESASYDKVEGGDTTIISNDGAAATPSGGGGGSSLSLVGGSDFYRAAQLNRKKSNLAKVWA